MEGRHLRRHQSASEAWVASFLEESPEAAGRVHPTGLGSIICYANPFLSILADTGRPRKPGPVALLADPMSPPGLMGASAGPQRGDTREQRRARHLRTAADH